MRDPCPWYEVYKLSSVSAALAQSMAWPTHKIFVQSRSDPRLFLHITVSISQYWHPEAGQTPAQGNARSRSLCLGCQGRASAMSGQGRSLIGGAEPFTQI